MDQLLRRLQEVTRGAEAGGGGGWQEAAGAVVTVLMELIFGASGAWTDADALSVADVGGDGVQGGPAPTGALQFRLQGFSLAPSLSSLPYWS